MAAALRCGDAVKFAKYLPPAQETTDSISAAKELIEFFKSNSTPSPVTAKG
jgi:hypothetical protein